MPEEATVGQFKSQPWILFDTIVAKSFLLGDNDADGLAVGSQTPAISRQGEIVFFNGGGRTQATYPWYTNLDISGQLAYGMEVWQIYLLFAFPSVTPAQNNGYDITANPGVPPTLKLIEAILNFGVLEMELGQENQTRWPLTRFGAGGGIVASNTAAVVNVQNSQQQSLNVLKLAEPIEMPRTQTFSAKIRLASEALPMIGQPAPGVPGVGQVLQPYTYNTTAQDSVDLDQLPFSIQLGLVGRRTKKTQYGQTPGETPGTPPPVM